MLRFAGLYELLYLLTVMTGNPRYGAAADAALRFFLASCLVPQSGLLAWGTHAQWDFYTDTWARGECLLPSTFRDVLMCTHKHCKESCIKRLSHCENCPHAKFMCGKPV